MVPKVAGKGASFKGAGEYYLHDKNASTKERIAFTHTENLPTDDPDLSIRLMARTAINQAKIKAANDDTVKTGRKLQKPVYAYSLSWSPDEAPTQAEMIEAARETMVVLGLQGHEVLMVSHNDEPHPHIHLIVNRVHPETGLAAKLSNDHLKLSKWAEEYEKKHGKIRCEQRVENNEKRRQGQFVKDLKSWRKAQFHANRKLQLRQAFQRRQIEQKSLAAHQIGERTALTDQQASEWLALYNAKEEHIKAVRQQVRAANKPKWAEIYRRHRQEKRELNQAQKTAYSRLRYFLKQYGKDSTLRAAIKNAIRAMAGRDNPHAQLARKHEAVRKALAAEIRGATLLAMREENRIYRRERDKLEDLHRHEKTRLQDEQRKQTQTLAAEHSTESQDLAREIKQQAAEQSHEEDEPKEPPALTDEFTKRVAGRIRQRRKRDDRGRGRGHGHERDDD